MITLTIEGKDYKCPSSYKDVTLSKFKELQQFLESDYNKEIVEKIIESKVDDEERALNFYLDLINYVTDIPKKVLKQVPPYEAKEGISIQMLFEAISFLLFMPQIENPEPTEQIEDYYFIDKIDLTQAILKDLKFIEYQEANAVINAFNRLEEGRYDQLNYLLAIMYRPKETTGKWFWKKEVIEEYDSDNIRERAKWFDKVDMHTVWNCLFFFMQLKTNSLTNIEQSLKVALEKEHQD